MNLKKLTGFLLLATMLLVACSKKGPTYTQYIPKDAGYVMAFDVKSMVLKLEKDNLKVEDLLAVLKDSTDPSKYTKALETWKDFKDAGLDLESKLLVSIPKLDLDGGTLFVQTLVGLKDADKLKAFIAKMPEAPKVQEEKDFSYAINDDMVVAWKKDVVMMVAGGETPNLSQMDDLLKGDTNNMAAPALPGNNAGLLEKVKKYFSLKKEESIASEDAFNKLMAEKADVAMFSSSSSLASSQAMAMATMPKVKELIEGIYSTSTINFEDGEVRMTGNSYMGKKLGEILKKNSGSNIDASLVEPFASDNVTGLTAFSFKPQLIGDLLKETGFDALVNMGLAQSNLTIDEVLKAFKGDFAIIFSDFKVEEVDKTDYNGNSYKSKEPGGNMIMAVRLGDKAVVDKLLDMGTKMDMLTRQGNRLVMKGPGSSDTKTVMGIENDLFVVGSTEAVYKSYVAKSGKIKLSPEATDLLKNNSMAFYFDANKLLTSIPETMFDSTETHEKNILNKSKSLFKEMSFSTGHFDGKSMSGVGSVKMMEKTNSLPQLVRFLMYVAEEMKLKKAEERASGADIIPSDWDSIPEPAKEIEN